MHIANQSKNMKHDEIDSNLSDMEDEHASSELRNNQERVTRS